MSNIDNAGPTQDNQRPPWLPENFDSPEALATSYTEAQRKITEQGNELSQLREDVESLSELAATLQQQPQQQQYQPQNEAEIIAGQYAEAMENGDYRTALAIQAQITALAAQASVQQAFQQHQPDWQRGAQAQIETAADFAVNSLRAQYPDWQEHEDKVEQVIKNSPHLAAGLQSARTPNEFYATLDNAYRLVKYDELVNGHQQQAQSFAQAEAAKLAAQTATGAGPGRVMAPGEAQAEWDAIKKAGASSPWTS